MSAIAPEILLESKTARDGQLAAVNHEAASDVLSKAKALIFALWQGTGAATTEQMAEFYEVPVNTIKSAVKDHKAEFEADGLKVLRGKHFKDVSSLFQLSSQAHQLTVWTPRAALRLGMLLRDSEVAKQVRTVLLDVAEEVAAPAQPSQLSSLDALVQSIPALAQVAQSIADMERRLLEQEKAISQLVAERASLNTLAQSVPTLALLTQSISDIGYRLVLQEATTAHLTDARAKMLGYLLDADVALFNGFEDIGALERRLATQYTQVQQHERILSELKREKDEASRRLEELPPPTVETPPLTIRQLVRRLVNDFSSKTGVRQADLWRRLYQELYYRCKINLSRRAKRKNQSRLDVIEEVGLLDDLYAIASEVLV